VLGYGLISSSKFGLANMKIGQDNNLSRPTAYGREAIWTGEHERLQTLRSESSWSFTRLSLKGRSRTPGAMI